jgi:hypothetical protein
MPNCFRLYPKSPEAMALHGNPNAAILQKVDEHICTHFGVEVHPKYWCGDWYHVIGFLIALKGFHLGSRDLRMSVARWYDAALYKDKIERWSYLKDQMLILRFLEKHYQSDSWVEIGRR